MLYKLRMPRSFHPPNEQHIVVKSGRCGPLKGEKYQSRDEKFPEPNGEGNLVSRFNYTEYYLEHWLNK